MSLQAKMSFMFKNSWFFATPNPFKLCVIILTFLSNIEKRHISLVNKANILKERVFKLTNLLLDANENVNEVRRYLNDWWYNRLKTIDWILLNDIDEVLMHPNVEINIINMWNGPYVNEFFLNSSFVYSSLFNQASSRACKLKNKKSIAYKESNMLINHLWNCEMINFSELKWANFFMFVQWK